MGAQATLRMVGMLEIVRAKHTLATCISEYAESIHPLNCSALLSNFASFPIAEERRQMLAIPSAHEVGRIFTRMRHRAWLSHIRIDFVAIAYGSYSDVADRL